MLDLSCNLINDIGATMCGELLRTPTSALRFLNFSFNRIGRGIQYIAQALALNRSLVLDGYVMMSFLPSLCGAVDQARVLARPLQERVPFEVAPSSATSMLSLDPGVVPRSDASPPAWTV